MKVNLKLVGETPMRKCFHVARGVLPSLLWEISRGEAVNSDPYHCLGLALLAPRQDVMLDRPGSGRNRDQSVFQTGPFFD